MDSLVFQGIVHVFSFIGDRRFNNFKVRSRPPFPPALTDFFRPSQPVLDLYISQHFTGSTAASHIISSLQRLLRAPTDPENATTLRSAIKVWKWLFKLVVRSREIQRSKGLGSGVTSGHLEASFKSDLSSLLNQVNSLMRSTTPTSIIGTQTLVVQVSSSSSREWRELR